jgi:chromosome segregation ATPase
METLKTILEQQLEALKLDLQENEKKITELESSIALYRGARNNINKMARDIQKKMDKIK